MRPADLPMIELVERRRLLSTSLTAGTLRVYGTESADEVAFALQRGDASTLRVSVNANGDLYVNGDKFADDAAAVARIKEVAATVDKPKAIIAGDRKTAYGGVMRAIDLVQQAGITAIALENERP